LAALEAELRGQMAAEATQPQPLQCEREAEAMAAD